MQNRQAIRKAVKAALEAITGHENIGVFAQRRAEISETTSRFINVYFSEGTEARKSLSEVEDEAELIIRISSSKVLNVDDDLDAIAEPIEKLMQSYSHASIDHIERSGWSYGDENETPFSYLELTYNVEFIEEF